MIETLLISGAGESAHRVERTCERIGVALAASELELDETGTPDIEALLATATRTGAQAVYAADVSPRATVALAERIRAAGLQFVGPSQEALVALADKWEMRSAAMSAGLGVLPAIGPFEGWNDQIPQRLEAAGIETPVVVKPVAGAQRVGIVVVRDDEQLKEAVQSASATSKKRFGDERVILEAYVPRARELELTLMADAKGTYASLPERETSLRCNLYPWLIESPSPLFSLQRNSDQFQSALLESAIELARTIQLVGVATFEFLVDPQAGCFFRKPTPLLRGRI